MRHTWFKYTAGDWTQEEPIRDTEDNHTHREKYTRAGSEVYLLLVYLVKVHKKEETTK